MVVTLAVPVVAFVGMWGTWAWGMYAYATHDRLGFIENSTVIAAVEEPCAEMVRSAKGGLPEQPAQRSTALTAFRSTARSIPTAIESVPARELEKDLPAAWWAEDWTTLLSAVDEYASSLRQKGMKARFAMPLTEDGVSIVTRMNMAAPEGCAVPDMLVALDPSAPVAAD